jgi:hypothetical protein
VVLEQVEGVSGALVEEGANNVREVGRGRTRPGNGLRRDLDGRRRVEVLRQLRLRRPRCARRQVAGGESAHDVGLHVQKLLHRLQVCAHGVVETGPDRNRRHSRGRPPLCGRGDLAEHQVGQVGRERRAGRRRRRADATFVQDVQADRHVVGEQLARQAVQRGDASGRCVDGRGEVRSAAQDVADERAQGGSGADLHEDAGAVGVHALDGLAEPDW